ncbi:hypothetical protein PROFUN_05349 [Planoprotostelium fungivorum]|uniref:Transcriptional adapter n=1 Tax=Planoprotostelium fungivorum TaxID=1890364 RepID=A0A2P6NR68_9EUKA|nr:hypothetical protein PROFUN_05349 [Planoprotostelium fungivorum]
MDLGAFQLDTPGKRPPEGSLNDEPRPKRRVRKSDSRKQVRYHCNYCGKDISNVVRVKCAVCPDFDLCVQCFSVGVELTGHKNNHDYHIMDILNFPLFDEEWGADEELLLLEAIEMYGFGNWIDAADHVGTKNLTQCKDHYFATYINVPSCPLPDVSKILTTTESLQRRNNMGDNYYEEVEYVDEEDKEKEQAKNTEAKKTVKKDNTRSSTGFTYHELAGYMPHRGDFETEYENEGETWLMEMDFNNDDTPAEKEEKLKIIEIYNQKLDERAYRKNFIRERNLLEYKKRKLKEDREIFDRLRVFSRLMTKEEHDDLINGLITERNLRKKIEELKKYRRMGLRTSAEMEEYETGKPVKSHAPTRKAASVTTLSRGSRGVSRESSLATPTDAGKKGKKKGLGPPLDVNGKPGIDLLSEKEKELCSTIRIYPQQYLIIKSTLLEYCATHENVKRSTARSLIKMDVNKTGRIWDFMEACGWVNNPNTRPTSTTSNTCAVKT